MKIFNWVHKTFHHSVTKEGYAYNVKKTETTVSEVDKQALLKEVDIDDALHVWKAGILTIGTFGFESLKLSTQQKEYLVLDSEEEEEEANYFGTENDQGNDNMVEDEEINPLMLATLGPQYQYEEYFSGENNSDVYDEKDDKVIMTIDGFPLSPPIIEAYEISIESKRSVEIDEKKKKGERITLADLFLADADVKLKIKSEKDGDDLRKKSDVNTKYGLSFAKKFFPRVKDDSHPIKNIQRLMKRMMKRKIHPEIDDKVLKSDCQLDKIGHLTNSETEAYESVYLLPTQDATV